MHYQLDGFAVGVVVESLDVEVGIWRLKVKNHILAKAKPIFPTDVPTFHKHCVKSMAGSKVGVFPYILFGGAVLTVGLCLGVVVVAQFDTREVVGVTPLALACNHFPINTHIFAGFIHEMSAILRGLLRLRVRRAPSLPEAIELNHLINNKKGFEFYILMNHLLKNY